MARDNVLQIAPEDGWDSERACQLRETSQHPATAKESPHAEEETAPLGIIGVFNGLFRKTQSSFKNKIIKNIATLFKTFFCDALRSIRPNLQKNNDKTAQQFCFSDTILISALGLRDPFVRQKELQRIYSSVF